MSSIEMSPVLQVGSLGGLQLSTVGDQATTINMIIFGDSGVGKTVLAASASLVPEMSPVLLIDVEGGILSLRHRYPKLAVRRVTSFVEIQTMYDALFKGGHPFKTVIIDSITETQKFGMYHIMERTVAKEPDRDPDLPGIGEWGKSSEQTRKLIRAWRDLPGVNTIFTALATDSKSKMGVTTTLPDLPGKSAAQAPALVDEVLYMYVKEWNGEYQRFLLGQKTERIVAKDRSDNLPGIMQEPTMQKLFDHMTHRIKREENTTDPKKVSE